MKMSQKQGTANTLSELARWPAEGIGVENIVVGTGGVLQIVQEVVNFYTDKKQIIGTRCDRAGDSFSS